MASPENICVGCELPLVRGQRYGIRRGQLWHSHCYVAFGGKTNRERELERKLEQWKERAIVEAQNAHRAESARDDEARSLRAALHTIKITEDSRDQYRKDVASHRRELAAVRDILTMTRNDLDRVQRELVEAQRAAAAPPPPPVVTPPVETAKKPDDDDYTGIETRFSLLELD